MMKPATFNYWKLRKGNDPIDFLGLQNQKVRKVLLGALKLERATLLLWHRSEQLEPGVQRFMSYVTSSADNHKEERILAALVFLTAQGAGSISRDATLPGWNGSNGIVDCVGAGAAGAWSGGGGYGQDSGGGGGGGGCARSIGGVMNSLGPTVTYVVGAPSYTANITVAGGATSFNGGYNVAYGGAGANNIYGGGYSGAGTGNYQNLQGGPGGNGGTASTYYVGGGGGGGAAGIYGGGGMGESWSNDSVGGNGGYGDGGYGGFGGVGGHYANGYGTGAAGGAGNEWGGGGGCGGGGGGGGHSGPGGPGGSYGGGGGGGGTRGPGTSYHPGSQGYQGIIALSWTPLAAPVVSTCSPSSGPTAGGTALTITGSGFVNVTSVGIGGNYATNVVAVNSTTITCTTVAHTAGLCNISVYVSGGVPAGTGYNLYTYVAPNPVVTSCTPPSGTTEGGTPVTITGTDFTGATSVTFGGTAALDIIVVNATTITCTTPVHAAGLVDVVVSVGSQVGTGVGKYTFVTPFVAAVPNFNMPSQGF